jgi:hypothetical protein
VGDKEARGRVNWARGSWPVAGDVEQCAVDEGLTSASLAIGPGSEKELHKVGMTVDQTLGLDGDVEW